MESLINRWRLSEKVTELYSLHHYKLQKPKDVAKVVKFHVTMVTLRKQKEKIEIGSK